MPILHEFKPDNIHHIVNHSEAKAVLAASSNWENMNERMMPDVKLFMMLDNFSIIHSKSKEVRVVRDRINEYFGKKYPRSFTSNDVRYHVEKPEEFAAILDIYNRYPICELTIHPRVMHQQYLSLIHI